MAPKRGLPLNPEWEDEDTYVNSLLYFATDSDLFRNLCGGIHILDFLTREPDLYTSVLPTEWRDWFDKVEVVDVLDLFLRQDLSLSGDPRTYEKNPPPPTSLFDYARTIRSHYLQRSHVPVSDAAEAMPRHIAVGMKPKKLHEVSNFAAYVNKLSADVMMETRSPVRGIVDFGSGQNYLGRALASPPFKHDILAVERKHHNIDGAKGMDVFAKLAKKKKIMRNKKEFKLQMRCLRAGEEVASSKSLPSDSVVDLRKPNLIDDPPAANREAKRVIEEIISSEKGTMTYIEHDIRDGYLENIISSPSLPKKTSPACLRTDSDVDNASIQTSEASFENSTYSAHSAQQTKSANSKFIVVSLHSCGNLVHHGLRSLILNPSVSAVAMIGCCYNLMTERLGPATYKLPTLRPFHPRLESTSNAYDPHGFPLSQRFERFEHKYGQGVRLNITARMMAVQAPYNWGHEDSEAFFKRHFYRALLQRILLDRGVVMQCSDPDNKDTSSTALIVGSLGKSCFTSFHAYVRGALAKLANDRVDGHLFREHNESLADEEISQYEMDWGYAKKNLSIVWSLMAFSAGVVESMIAVDRWLYLREQECVQHCWVEPVFDYALSPRNLVVVGIKRQQEG